MPAPKLSDRETLRQLLESGKLNADESQTFRTMYDDLVAGRIALLDRKQRLWAETLYNEKYKLGEERAKTGKKRSTNKNKELLATFDAMPRPKKPPGRT